MPKRQQPDPLITRAGQRFRQLRKERRYTLKQVTEGAGYTGTGFLSQFENGEALPSLVVLERMAVFMEVALFDLFVFPERSPRDLLAETTRSLGERELDQLLEQALAYRAQQTQGR